jgi:regulator of cell morphogenesis and NO signaling
MKIIPKMKMAEVIHLNYHLLPIISRFGIHLGFGEKTIEQLCIEYNLDLNFFLVILNSYHDKDYFPRKHLQGFPVELIIEYLRKSHEYYLKIKIPLIDKLLKQLSLQDKGLGGESLLLINKFFNEYKHELSTHIQREEDKVYPYIFTIEDAFRQGKSNSDLVALIRKYSIDDYENEHDNVEDKLYDLQNIIIKYLPPPLDMNLCHTVLMEMFRLESDLYDHARIEDMVLVPKVRFMEKWIEEHFTP